MTKTITVLVGPIKAEVEILGARDYPWGTDLIARVTHTGGVASGVMSAPSAAAKAYHILKQFPEPMTQEFKMESTLSSLTDPHTWYVHLKLLKREEPPPPQADEDYRGFQGE